MHYRPLDSVRLVPGVGPKTVEHMDRMGIRTIHDLLNWFPRRYIDATNPIALNLVPLGMPQAIRVTVDKVTSRRTKQRNVTFLDVQVSDDSGVDLILRFFNQPYLSQKLVEGSEWTCVGSIERFHSQLIMGNPVVLESPQVIPVYLQTKGVSSWMLQKCIRAVLPAALLTDVLPPEIRTTENLPDYAEMLRLIHIPESVEEAEKGRDAMAFLEVFTFFMQVQLAQQVETEPGTVLNVPVEWLQKVVSTLPFELTAGQKRVVWDMLQEMQSGALMTRLLNGDVGAGKTVVAALLAACMAENKKRTLFLAPTEILAQQHAYTLNMLLRQAGCRIAVWTASTKDETDGADIIVGTHALLQDSFQVNDVGLVIVDEQHRFGVKQRALLRDRQAHPPHVLAMTATPIPRTLALVLFADLQVSFLKEKPKNRLPIMTQIIPVSARGEMEARIRSEIQLGHQVFVLCPLIESEDVFEEGQMVIDPKQIRTVTKEAERLKQEHPEFGVVAALHGKMNGKEKVALMEELKAGRINVLVATSVIEVGVDLPNATVIVVENAERFGLAQLHQLRGRVGRSGEQAYCFLCPTVGGGPAIERLQVLVDYDSGFDIAERDLQLRGPGDLVGTVQSGLPDFKLAKLTDLEFLMRVKESVQKYTHEHPEFLLQWQHRGISELVTGLE
jgi:ATP-dependent DNA helicase RecG